MGEHVPVLLNEMLEALAPADGEIYLDATFGGGGYATAILERANCTVIGLDRDPSAIKRAEVVKTRFGERFRIYQGTFAELPDLAKMHGIPNLDGIVFDFGVSSFQIDEAERGFSFRFDGPLDMRMSGEGITAADVVNTYTEVDLANVIYRFGEEKRSRAIARAIVAQRKVKMFESTMELANLIKSSIGGRPDAQHPATLTFQALRILVNNELMEIERGLAFAENHLKSEGRLVAVTFHSLEDRLVKNFIKDRSTRAKAVSRLLPGEVPPKPSTFRDLYPRGVGPSAAEVKSNSRSRSARLRAAVRLNHDQSRGGGHA